MGAVVFTIGSVVAVSVFSAFCSIGLGSGIDTLSPESADGKSQVSPKINRSSVTNSQESVTSPDQL